MEMVACFCRGSARRGLIFGCTGIGLAEAPVQKPQSILTKGVPVKHPLRTFGAAVAALLITTATSQVMAHGDVVPQAVDTTGLANVGSEWQKSNPFRKNAIAIKIGASAFNQNCARCHGLGAISGGIAPDLRYLPEGEEGDEIFLGRIRHGSVRDGRVYMPPFEGVFSQEAMWAIRAWLETVHEE
jgi:cytochrome c-550 PedF